ncbi:unnamed protein product, partial [Amoebophrya sp. A25]|eukprot:GSA25T00004329001.1
MGFFSVFSRFWIVLLTTIIFSIDPVHCRSFLHRTATATRQHAIAKAAGIGTATRGGNGRASTYFAGPPESTRSRPMLLSGTRGPSRVPASPMLWQRRFLFGEPVSGWTCYDAEEERGISSTCSSLRSAVAPKANQETPFAVAACRWGNVGNFDVPQDENKRAPDDLKFLRGFARIRESYNDDAEARRFGHDIVSKPPSTLWGKTKKMNVVDKQEMNCYNGVSSTSTLGSPMTSRSMTRKSSNQDDAFEENEQEAVTGKESVTRWWLEHIKKRLLKQEAT